MAVRRGCVAATPQEGHPSGTSAASGGAIACPSDFRLNTENHGLQPLLVVDAAIIVSSTSASPPLPMLLPPHRRRFAEATAIPLSSSPPSRFHNSATAPHPLRIRLSNASPPQLRYRLSTTIAALSTASSRGSSPSSNGHIITLMGVSGAPRKPMVQLAKFGMKTNGPALRRSRRGVDDCGAASTIAAIAVAAVVAHRRRGGGGCGAVTA